MKDAYNVQKKNVSYVNNFQHLRMANVLNVVMDINQKMNYVMMEIL